MYNLRDGPGKASSHSNTTFHRSHQDIVPKEEKEMGKIFFFLLFLERTHLFVLKMYEIVIQFFLKLRFFFLILYLKF